MRPTTEILQALASVPFAVLSYTAEALRSITFVNEGDFFTPSGGLGRLPVPRSLPRHLPYLSSCSHRRMSSAALR